MHLIDSLRVGVEMRGEGLQSEGFFSYLRLEQRIPADHPLRAIRELVDAALKEVSRDFDKLYARDGRPSIPPERLLRALLLQTFYTVRSERQLMEQLDYNLLFRWFVGLSIDDPVWDATVFCKNRDRLLDGDIAAKFFVAVLNPPPVRKLLSSDHFSVDGTLIEAWASVKSFVPKDDGDPPSGIDGERDGLDDMVSRFADQPVVETAAGVTRRSLRHDRVRGVEIAINVYKPRTASATEPVAHDGCEFGVVLDGILEVTVGGRIHKLQKGDLISYPSTEPHRFANTSSSPARTIWLNLKRDPMQ